MAVPSLAVADRYAAAIDIVGAWAQGASSSYFTAAYGRSHVRICSNLFTPNDLRRFTPREILRLLGFPESFCLPDRVPFAQAWRRVGSRLSVVAVRHVLAAIPELADP